MVQSVDEKSDVLAHVNIDVVFFGKKFFRLVDKVCCHYAVDETTFKGFVKFLQSVCEKTKCGSEQRYGLLCGAFNSVATSIILSPEEIISSMITTSFPSTSAPRNS